MDKQLMFKAEMLNKQLEEMEHHLHGLDERKAQVRGIQHAIEEFTKIETGAEMLVPLSSGLFARCTYTGDPNLLVNVGKGTVVTRTPDAVVEELHKQVAVMDEHQGKMQEQFRSMLAELDELKEAFNEAK